MSLKSFINDSKTRDPWAVWEISQALLFDLNSSLRVSDAKEAVFSPIFQHAWSFMLTQMPKPTTPASVTSGSSKPMIENAGPKSDAMESPIATPLAPKAIAIGGHTESLRYLLRHLTASWAAKPQTCNPGAASPVDQQEH